MRTGIRTGANHSTTRASRARGQARGGLGWIALGIALLAAPAFGAEPSQAPLTLEQAVSLALAHHPQVRAALDRADAAAADLDATRAAELPQAGLSAQLNRSTGNAVPGTFFTTAGFASISGSPRGRALSGDTWQSGASLWASWSATGLGQELAQVDAALAAQDAAALGVRATRLEVAFRASDAFLAVLAADAQVRAAQASVDRARTFATVVKTLVAQNLRPGVDAARVDAEVALALTQEARSREGLEQRLAQLAGTLGVPEEHLAVAPGALLGVPPPEGAPPAATSAAAHPLVEVQQALADQAQAVAHVADLQYLPRVELVAALWARGSGYYPGGLSAAGLVPDTPNWAAGVVFTWPLTSLPAIRDQARAAHARAGAASARRDEVALKVSEELSQASAMLQGARRVAANTPVALAAARAAETGATARYRAALSSILDVADAQRVLAQAELDDDLARLEVRRALLYLARARGDLEPFLASARQQGATP